jgi:hypothetical protein
MSSISINVDVDVDDIILSMSRFERRNFLLAMQDNGYIPDNCDITNDGCVDIKHHDDNEFNTTLINLMDIGWKLNKEDYETIINTAKKYI